MADAQSAGDRTAGGAQPELLASEACRRFEQSWQEGRPLRIEEVVESVPESEHRALLFGLLRREISYRHLRGEQVSAEDYRDRFGSDTQLFAAIFAGTDRLRALLDRCGYDLLERIESGRAGDVYRVLHREQQRLYAVKVVPALLVRSDAREARGLLDLDYLLHPHISRPTELLEVNGTLLLFNEYVEGMNFAQLVAELGVLPVGAACELACQVAAGLDQLHAHGRAHGALTPTTMILATQAGEVGTVKLGSVGLTDVADLKLTRFAHTALQSECDWRLFAAPEIADHWCGGDPRSDVYSLGCTLRLLLSGARPQNAPLCASQEGIRVLWKKTALAGARGEVPPQLVALIDQMTATDPAQRLASAAVVVSELQPYRDPALFARLLTDVVAAVNRRQRLEGGVRVAGPVPRLEPAAPTPTPREPPRTATVVCHTAETVSADADATSTRHRRILAAWACCAMVVASIATVSSFFVRGGGDRPSAEVWEYTGPAGVAWFDQIPWYTPCAREEMARRLASGQAEQREGVLAWLNDQQHGAGDAGSNALQTLVEQAATARAEPEWVVTRSLLERSQHGSAAPSLATEYARLAGHLHAAQRASAVHLRALLWHAAGDSQRARADYRRALELYAHTSPSLRALCASDFARLAYDDPRLEDDPEQLLLDEAIPHASSAVFQVRLRIAGARVARCMSGDLARAQRLVDESGRICDASQLPFDHAARCELTEEKAWLALEQWRLAEAHQLFRDALQVREQSTGDVESDRWRHVLTDVQGMARIALLQGDQHQAVELLRSLLAATDTAPLAQALIMSSTRARQLEALRPQLLADLGDILLAGPDYDYSQAQRCYQQAVASLRADRPPAPSTIVWQYQRSLARVLQGDPQGAREELEEADALAGAYGTGEAEALALAPSALPPASQRERSLWLYRSLAHAAVDLRGGDAARHAPALARLEQLACAGNESPREATVRLLAAQLLLEDTRCPPPRTARVVSELASLVKRCNQQAGHTAQGYLERFARLAHYAGCSAQASLSASEDASRLQASIAVLEKAHRVLPLSPMEGNPTRISQRSQLHTMAVGVSQYAHHSADSPLDLLSAHRDAIELDQAYDCLRRQDRQGRPNPCGLYASSPCSRLLVDQQATRAAILEFIEELRTVPAADLRQDLVIISLSGHGLQDADGSLYFLPHDYQPGSLLSSGLSIDLFQSKLRMLGANVLLIIDTCYSGAARDTEPHLLLTRTTEADVDRALRSLANSETALAVLVAGKAREKAGESQLFGGHGALTAAVLEFLRQERLELQTKDHARPVPLRSSDNQELLTLEDLRRYVVDRVAQFPLVHQRPNLYTSGQRLGDYSCEDIPLRFASSASEPDQEAGPPQLGPNGGP